LPGAGVLTQVAIGSDQSCGLDGSGNALCWGSNEYGQFGDGDQQLVGIPTPTVVWGSAP
jgi:alpha-tubulin suppressor-like RCC1 family protein